MTEWRLFPEGTVPDFTTPEFFAAHGWVPPEHQLGHAERISMTADLVREMIAAHGCTTLSDLGCGDGSLLAALRDVEGVRMWGYDAGRENLTVGIAAGLDVREADLLTSDLEYGQMVTASEVLEHLVDPHGFLAKLPGEVLVVSSPSAETDEWHYVHHSWAWDLKGYRALVTGAGWKVVKQIDCDGLVNYHNGIERPQRFQAIAAVRRG
jgi:hypothetical protein